jgi:hypothetical protein
MKRVVDKGRDAVVADVVAKHCTRDGGPSPTKGCAGANQARDQWISCSSDVFPLSRD